MRVDWAMKELVWRVIEPEVDLGLDVGTYDYPIPAK